MKKLARPVVTPEPPDPADPRGLALPIILVLFALAAAVALWRMQPPAPLPASAPADRFSAGRAEEILAELLGPEQASHPSGSAENAAVRKRILAQLTDLGYEVELQAAPLVKRDTGASVMAAYPQNILARLPGRESGRALLLAAHYDSEIVSPGAADNGASVAALLEIARVLKAHGPYRRPIILLFTDAEELTMLGAQLFVEEHPWASDIGAVLNTEARGTSGQSLMFETSAGNDWLIEAYARAVPHPASNSLMVEAYKLMPNNTDLSVFMRAGMAGANFAFIENAHRYHTTLDNLSNLDRGSLQHQGEGVLALAQALAEQELVASPSPADAAYTDLLGLTMIRWPMRWNQALAIGLLVVLLYVAALLVWQKQTTLKALGWGLLGALLALALAAVLGMGIAWLLPQATGQSDPWYAYPWLTRLAIWAAALAVVGALGALVGRRAGLWGFGLAFWFIVAALALAAGFLMPGAAIILWLPAALAAALLFFAPILARRLPWMGWIAFGAPALAGVILWLPLALRLEQSVGFRLSAPLALLAALALGALLPFAAAPNKSRRLLPLAAAAVFVISLIAALFAPTYSAASPQIYNILHFEDRDSGAAYWVGGNANEPLPASLRSQFDSGARAVLPWSQRQRLVSASKPTNRPASRLEILSERSSTEGYIVQLRLRRAAGAYETDVLVPITKLRSVYVNSVAVPIRAEDSWNGFYNLWCFGHDADGLEITLRFADESPVEIWINDYWRGLPSGGERFLQARPDTLVPAYSGDATIVLSKLRL